MASTSATCYFLLFPLFKLLFEETQNYIYESSWKKERDRKREGKRREKEKENSLTQSGIRDFHLLIEVILEFGKFLWSCDITATYAV